MTKTDPSDIYRKIGVRPAINASGTTTAFGGTKLRPEIMPAMEKAASVLVDIHELNQKVGSIIAELIGAEAAFVSSGSAGGLVLQAAAVIAGKDPGKMAQIPDTTGMKNEIIIQNCQRFAYDQAYRAAGAKLIGIGEGRRCHPWQLESAFTEKTAAVAYLISPFYSRRALSLEDVCKIAHARDIPVIVDAASTLPPRENLKTAINAGADMVILSGGKGIRGPQGTGILLGRKDLIEAASANASPNQFIGRSMKVSKEEIIGLLEALNIFIREDEEEETRNYMLMTEKIVDSVAEFSGIEATIKHDKIDYLIPTAVLKFTANWIGPTRNTIFEMLSKGDPPIFLHTLGNPDELGVDPMNLDEQELETLIHRLSEELAKSH